MGMTKTIGAMFERSKAFGAPLLRGALILAPGFQGCSTTAAEPFRDTAAAGQTTSSVESHGPANAGNSAPEICDQSGLLPYIAFEPGSSDLVPCAIQALDDRIKTLRQYPDLRVEVAGHTDSAGDGAHKKALSLQRAQVVYDYLIAHGVPSSMLIGPVGYGSERPVRVDTESDGSTIDQDAARLNRRVDLDVQHMEPVR